MKAIEKIETIGWVLVLVFIFLLIMKLRQESERILREGGEVVVTVISKKRSYVRFTYVIDGVEYENSDKPDLDIYRSIKAGERYMAKYDRNNPRSSIVFFSKPVMTEGEFAETEATLVDERSIYVKFKYSVNGQVYSRWQILDRDESFDAEPYLNKKIKAKYNVEDPNIAYLLL